ncbi:hypothetical protein [Streptomyces sp. MP131-18]|uniref:hypothetical protein n=1 Tax=Streptomyces sp. MP131-18 TaxID=1857892 RepID=UPI00097CA06F|nr:hypothetical protein [Streptomyces sp. MP131-18]ONK13272.1 hypothetical protein STBA_40350 [Streptomyces sp. MP131-18]
MTDLNQQHDRAAHLLLHLLHPAPRTAHVLTVVAIRSPRTVLHSAAVYITAQGVLAEQKDMAALTVVCALGSTAIDGGLIALDDMRHVCAWALRAGYADPLTAGELRAHDQAAVLLSQGSQPIDAYPIPDDL